MPQSSESSNQRKTTCNSLVNGQMKTTLDIQDRGLQYGDGLFETIAVIDGSPQFLDKHLDRLLKGCAKLLIPEPERALLESEVLQLCGGSDKAVLKIIITRGTGGRGYRPSVYPEPTRIISLHEWPDYPPDQVEKGIQVRYCNTRLSTNPALAGIKHLNRLEQVLARSEWNDPGIAEGLMLDASGFVIEGTMSNLFIVRDGILITPDLSGCGVEGIMRSIVIETASSMGVTHRILQITPQEISEADEIFICNSLIGIWPVCQLDQHSCIIGKITNQLVKAHTNE